MRFIKVLTSVARSELENTDSKAWIAYSFRVGGEAGQEGWEGDTRYCARRIGAAV